MKNVLRTARAKRTATLISFTTAAVLVAAGAASGAYSGKTSSGEILTCFSRSDGALRIVDHLPCRKGETVLRWNSRGPVGETGAAGQDGADGKAGADGAPGAPGAQGPAGSSGTSSAGQAGAAGRDGAAGPAGPQGETGPQGPAGADGQPGPAGARGNDGAVGPQGPAGPAGSASSSMQFGQATNNTDPDCAMVAPAGRATAAACSFGSIQNVGEYLPSNAVIGGFRVLLDRTVNAQVDIIARTLDPSTAAPVDAFVLCSVPAGSNTCAQAGERTLTGPNLLALQMSGDRSWTKARFGYSLVQR